MIGFAILSRPELAFQKLNEIIYTKMSEEKKLEGKAFSFSVNSTSNTNSLILNCHKNLTFNFKLKCLNESIKKLNDPILSKQYEELVQKALNENRVHLFDITSIPYL